MPSLDMPDILPGPSLECVYNCPLPVEPPPSGPRVLRTWEAYERIRRNVQASLDCTVGTVPVRLFLDTFLPPIPANRKGEILSSKSAFSALPPSGSTPSAIYDPLLSALNKSTKHKSRAPGFVFENTSIRSQYPHEPGFTKPHICCFTPENLERVRHLPLKDRAELGYAELFIEVRPDAALEHFVDPPTTTEPENWSAHDIVLTFEDSEMNNRVERAFGQHISYAMEIQARQQRVCLFSVSLCGSHARLFRWDRSGIIISRSFDIREQPDFLCEFLARFACAPDKRRGHDQSVAMASAEEEKVFREAISRHVQDQLGLTGRPLTEAVAAHYQKGHVMTMQVFVDRSGGSSSDVVVEHYLVSRPVASPLTLGVRATRGYWAVQASTRRVVFLKDTWRLPLETEGDVIASLHTAGVRNVPFVVAHGDVYHRLPSPGGEERSRALIQHTRTDIYDTMPWVGLVAGRKISVSTYVHYRIVLGTVGYGLKTFRGTDELLRATYDVFRAMRDALDKASRLHRDISIGNILLVREPGAETRTGYLIDWEASSRVDAEGKSLDHSRMGTWKFMSSKTLGDPAHPHAIQDDMESLLYVIFYCALLHLPHNLSPGTLQPLMHDFFDTAYFLSGEPYGGAAKIANGATRNFSSIIEWSNVDFRDWLNAAMDMNHPVRNPAVADPGPRTYPWADPDNLDTMWRTFLAERPLAREDRVDNKLSRPEPPSNEAPGSDVSLVVPSRPSAHAVNRGVGQSDAASLPQTRASKRRRISETGVLPGIRRSDRLRRRTESNTPDTQVPARSVLNRPSAREVSKQFRSGRHSRTG